jgi:MFS family permease
MTLARQKTASVRPYVTLFFLGLAYFFLFIDRQILTVLVDPIKGDLGISDTQFGLIQGFAFAAFYVSFGIPIAAIADRWNRKIVVASGLFLWSICTFFAGFARSFVWLFSTRAGVGVGESSLAPAAYSMLADLFGPKKIGRVIGFFQSFGLIGMAVSVALGGLLYQRFSSLGPMSVAGLTLPPWGMTLVSVAAPGMVLACAIYLFVPEPLRGDNPSQTNGASAAVSPRKSLIATLLDRHWFFVRLLAGCSLLSIASSAVSTWSVAYLMRAFQLSPAEAGLRYGLAVAVGGILGPISAGTLSDSFYKRIGNRAPIIMLIVCGVGLLLSDTGILFAESANIAVASLVLFSICISGANALAASAIQIGAHSGVRAKVSALWLCLYNLVGMGFGALLVGVMNDRVFHLPSAVGRSVGLVGIAAVVPAIVFIASLLGKKSQSAPIPSEEARDSQSNPA